MDAPSPSGSSGHLPRGHRQSWRPTRGQAVAAVVAILIVAVAAIGIGLRVTQAPHADPAWHGADEIAVVPSTGAPVALDHVARPNFRYSIVPGGVHSVIEMRQAIERDPVVAAHYAGLDPSKFRVERLLARSEAHVSYRVQDDVFWTRKKLVLNVAETVLTDGTTTIRARCGNRVSMEALGPALPREPAADQFEQLDEPVLVPGLPLNPSHLGAIVAPQPQSATFGDADGHPTIYGPLVSAPGPGGTSGVWTGASRTSDPGPLRDPERDGTSDPDSSLGSGPGGNSGDPGPDSGSDPGSDQGTNQTPATGSSPDPGSGLDLSLPPWPWLTPDPGTGPGPFPGPGPGQGQGPDPFPWPGPDPGPGPNPWPGPDPNHDPGHGPDDSNPTPVPTPEPGTLVLTALGAAGWYLTRVRKRTRRRRT